MWKFHFTFNKKTGKFLHSNIDLKEGKILVTSGNVPRKCRRFQYAANDEAFIG